MTRTRLLIEASGHGPARPFKNVADALADPTPVRGKLASCRIVVFDNDSDFTYATILIDRMRGKCASTTPIHFDFRGSSSITSAVQIGQGNDIVVIFFYRNHEDTVKEMIAQMRAAKPELYVVIASAMPHHVPSNLADMVLDKSELRSESLYTQFEQMLQVPALGSPGSGK